MALVQRGVIPTLLVLGVCFALSVSSAGSATRASRGGELDPTFGLNGTETAVLSEVAAGRVQPDGKLVVAGSDYRAPPCPACHGTSTVVVARFGGNGAYDQGFGKSGVWTWGSSGSDFEVATDVALQQDGKIVVAGMAGTFVLIRLTASGTPDPSFGTDGVEKLGFFSGSLEAITVDARGRVVGVGTSTQPGNTTDGWLVFRCLADGRLDQSFGAGGVARGHAFNGFGGSGPRVVYIGRGGKIIVAGSVGPPDGSYDSLGAGVARYTEAGNLDRTFGKGGVVTSGLAPAPNSGVGALAVSPNGKILVAVRDGIMRFTASGHRDLGFGVGGIARIEGGADDPARRLLEARTLAVEGRGGFVLGGGNGHDALVARFLPGGMPDPQFGDRGVAITRFGAAITTVVGLVRTPDSKLVAVASHDGGRVALARYLPRSCIVPGLVKMALGRAKVSLRNAACPLGTVRLVRSRRAARGFVMGQTPRESSILPADGAVDLVVGAGPRRAS
jgi:uncharacterized delta-60 repeat protein